MYICCLYSILKVQISKRKSVSCNRVECIQLVLGNPGYQAVSNQAKIPWSLTLLSFIITMKRKAETELIEIEDSRLDEEIVLAQAKKKLLVEDYARILKKLEKCIPDVINSFKSTMIFAQEEAGTAVFISESGIILTCGHCVGDSARNALGKEQVILFANGDIHTTKCVKFDYTRDLAVLKIISAAEGAKFPFICIDPSVNAKIGSSVFCFGQPGRWDLESARKRSTGYRLLQESDGKYLGINEDSEDPHDNSDIGQMSHTAWTYWGHSGAPIILKSTGALIGLHSSWDDETCTRHGVPLVAIVAFTNKKVEYITID